MSIIQFNRRTADTGNIKNNTELLLKDISAQTETLMDILQSAPAVLAGYANFRDILRYIKRTGNFEEALKKYSTNNCPPSIPDEEYCERTACINCWREFCQKYLQAIKK